MYDHKKIEKKWQNAWRDAGLYRADDDSGKERKYVLDMFPYPSGDGLHLGHIENYTATCIYSRYLRMKGFNVLHPIGWDAFGLPAENYAIKTGVHPDISTHQNIKNFTEQICALGMSYDWSREIDTSSPEYYKWTQWFFLLLYKNGLAYKKKAKVNWCEFDKTVLANEQAEGGICERCKNPVIQKDMDQWFFKITAFADDLINDLDTVDWPNSTISAQRNWIGRSEGVQFKMKIAVNGDISEEVELYTTRVDTIFGMTYIVLAPEHPLIAKILPDIKNKAEVVAYQEATSHRTELERTGQTKEKTGVMLSGVHAVHPFTKKEIPVFTSDYVIASYGTGAVMAVPAHDDRDFEFAKKFNLPILQVVCQYYPQVKCPILDSAYTGDGHLVMSEEFTGMKSEEARAVIATYFATHGIGGIKVNYRLRDWLISRQRYWGAPIPIIYCDDCGEQPVPEKDLPVMLPLDVDFRPTGESPLTYSKSFHEVSCPKCGKKSKRESDTMDTFVCSSWYYFRFADSRNSVEFAGQESIKKWLPVDMYMGGAEHSVLHLLYARFFTKVLHSLKIISFNEPFKKLRHQGLILGADGRKMSKSLGNVESQTKYVENYGADTLRLYEMFLGPIADMKPWNPDGIIGPRRFLERIWKLEQKVSFEQSQEAPTVTSLLHRTTRKVCEDIESFRFNTAISSMMILLNDMEKATSISRSQYEILLRLLAPFAPHITEELWHKIGNSESIHLAPWPVFDKSKIVESVITIAIQVNGKLRDTMTIEEAMTADERRDAALARPLVTKWTEGKTVKKIIDVPGKLFNIVISE